MAKILEGTIIATKMQKTVVVEVERVYRHPLYKKIVRRHKKYKAHNENMELKVGDMVKIKETKPLSKTKHFIVLEKKTK